MQYNQINFTEQRGFLCFGSGEAICKSNTKMLSNNPAFYIQYYHNRSFQLSYVPYYPALAYYPPATGFYENCNPANSVSSTPIVTNGLELPPSPSNTEYTTADEDSLDSSDGDRGLRAASFSSLSPPGSPGNSFIANDSSCTTYWRYGSPGPSVVTSDQIKGPKGANIFVFYLPDDCSNWDLYFLFKRFGNILSVHTMVDKVTHLSKGFGFISFSTTEEAEEAIKHMNGYMLGKKRLKVQLKNDEAHHVDNSDESEQMKHYRSASKASKGKRKTRLERCKRDHTVVCAGPRPTQTAKNAQAGRICKEVRGANGGRNGKGRLSKPTNQPPLHSDEISTLPPARPSCNLSTLAEDDQQAEEASSEVVDADAARV